MRSHLVGILIAGLMLMPIVRATPAGVTPKQIETACALCDTTIAETGEDPCCVTDQSGAPEDEAPCTGCPPLCCVVGPPSPVANSDDIGLQLAALPRALHMRPTSERAISRALAPDPPVPII